MCDKIKQTLNADIQVVLEGSLPKVVADFKKMPGSGKDAVPLLSHFKQGLMNYQAAYKANPKSPKLTDLIEALAGAASSSVLPKVAGQMAFNDDIQKMQPLNTKRIITPQDARAYNVNLEALHHDVQGIVSLCLALPDAEPVHLGKRPRSPSPDDADLEPPAKRRRIETPSVEANPSGLMAELKKTPIENDPATDAEIEMLSGIDDPANDP